MLFYTAYINGMDCRYSKFKKLLDCQNKILNKMLALLVNKFVISSRYYHLFFVPHNNLLWLSSLAAIKPPLDHFEFSILTFLQNILKKFCNLFDNLNK
jgi:hypothetical protein